MHNKNLNIDPMEELLRFSMMNGHVQIPSVSLTDWVFNQRNMGGISASKSAKVLKDLQANLPHSKTIWQELFSHKWFVFIGMTILLTLGWITFQTHLLDSPAVSINKSPAPQPTNEAGLMTVITLDSSFIDNNPDERKIIEKSSKENQINDKVKSDKVEIIILTEVLVEKETPTIIDMGSNEVFVPIQTFAANQPEEMGDLVGLDSFEPEVNVEMDSISQPENFAIFYKRNSVAYCDRDCNNYDMINALAQWMKSNPNKTILLIGYMDKKEKHKAVKHGKTCDASHCSYKSTAQSRVELLQSFFIKKGIDDSRIVTSLDSTEMDVADQQDLRKVEVIIR